MNLVTRKLPAYIKISLAEKNLCVDAMKILLKPKITSTKNCSTVWKMAGSNCQSMVFQNEKVCPFSLSIMTYHWSRLLPKGRSFTVPTATEIPTTVCWLWVFSQLLIVIKCFSNCWVFFFKLCQFESFICAFNLLCSNFRLVTWNECKILPSGRFLEAWKLSHYTVPSSDHYLPWYQKIR